MEHLPIVYVPQDQAVFILKIYKKAGGIGYLSEDVSDVLEAKVITNKTLPATEILELIKQDDWLYNSIVSEDVDDQLLIAYINDIVRTDNMIR